MKRAEVWTVSGGPDYAGKPRPAVVIQSDDFDATQSITVCALTTEDTHAPVSRPVVTPSEGNGLRHPSHVMIDKITTVPKTMLGVRIGKLGDDEMLRLNQAILVFLGLAG